MILFLTRIKKVQTSGVVAETKKRQLTNKISKNNAALEKKQEMKMKGEKSTILMNRKSKQK